MKGITNNDKILHSVIFDATMQDYLKEWHYDQSDFKTIDHALASDHPIISAIAKIITAKENDNTVKEIYKEVTNHLKNRI